MVLVGVYFSSILRKNVFSYIRNNSEVLADEILEQIDMFMFFRLEGFFAFVDGLSPNEQLEDSNRLFSMYGDADTVVKRLDQQWVSGDDEIKGIVDSVLNNDLVDKLRSEFEKKEFYKKISGTEVFTETIVANRYGANVAATNMTTDYYQADEEWWQIAMQNDLYISQIRFDRSAGLYTVAVAKRLTGDSGELAGVIKTNITVQSIIESLAVDTEVDFGDDVSFIPDIQLVDKNQKIIYDSQKQDNKKVLVFSRSSDGYKSFGGLGWMLRVKYRREDIDTFINNTVARMYKMVGAAFFLCLIFGVYMSRVMSRRIVDLKDTADNVAEGEYDGNIDFVSNDELGDLAESFRSMLLALKKYRKENSEWSLGLEEKVRRRTSALEKKQRELETANYELLRAKRKLEIFSSELENTVDARTHELTALYDISRSISHTVKCSELMSMVAAYLPEIMDVDICGFVYCEEKGMDIGLLPCKRVCKSAIDHFKSELIAEFKSIVAPEDIVTSWHIRTRYLQEPDLDSDKSFLIRKNEMSFFHIPFMLRGKIVGAVSVCSTKNKVIANADIDLLRDIVGLASMSYERLTNVIASEKSRMEAMVQSMIEGVIMIDTNNDIAVINPMARSMLGVDAHNFYASEDIINIFSSQNIYIAYDSVVENGNIIEGSFVLEKEDRLSEFSVDVSLLYNVYKEAIGVSVIMRDVTREKEIARLKTEFVSTVSHELRTPLVGLGNIINNLIEVRTESLSDRVHEKLVSAMDCISRLDRLIADLLDFSRIERGELVINYEYCSVNELIGLVIETVKSLIQQKDIDIELHLDPELKQSRIDKDRITQVLTNLIHNAIKFTPVKGKISIFTALYDHRILEAAVQDTGPGIAQEDQEKIFERFVQINRAEGGGARGTGIGLAIARSIIKAHGGRIFVESQIGVGSRFVFCIPNE